MLVHTGVDEKHVPDKRWLLDFVSTFKPDDEIFNKGCVPRANETKMSELKTIELFIPVGSSTIEPPRKEERTPYFQRGHRWAEDGAHETHAEVARRPHS
jgi:hypothetical protein